MKDIMCTILLYVLFLFSVAYFLLLTSCYTFYASVCFHKND